MKTFIILSIITFVLSIILFLIHVFTHKKKEKGR